MFNFNETGFRIPSLTIRQLVLCIVLLVGFRLMPAFPLMKIGKEILILCLAIFFLSSYFVWKISSRMRFSLIEIYILAMVFLIPIIAGIMAQLEFGQPFYLGALSQRNMILGIISIALIYHVTQRKISIADIEKSLISIAWISLAIYLFFEIAFDPRQFSEDSGLVGGFNSGSPEFRFNSLFICYGFFYYVIKGLKSKIKKFYLISLIFFFYILFIDQGRFLIVSTLATFIVFTWKQASLAKITLWIPKLVLLASLLATLSYTFNEEKTEQLAKKFHAAFIVVLTGEETSDSSANARLIATVIATPYIEKNWLLGSGDISNQWSGGYTGFFGVHFYPSDIGIIGVIFMFGYLGTLLFLMQFVFAYIYYHRGKTKKVELVMADVSAIFLLFIAINSLTTGKFAHYSEVSFFFIALLYCISKQSKTNSVETFR